MDRGRTWTTTRSQSWRINQTNWPHIFATTAFRIAQKHYASVFPLVYLQVLWSYIIGIYVFNEYMDVYAYLGAFLIVVSGVISLPSQIKQLKDAK